MQTASVFQRVLSLALGLTRKDATLSSSVPFPEKRPASPYSSPQTYAMGKLLHMVGSARKRRHAVAPSGPALLGVAGPGGGQLGPSDLVKVPGVSAWVCGGLTATLAESERVAGAIISPTEAGTPEISELIDSGACVVAFDRAVDDNRADAVLAGNVEGARLSTEHLLASGHTNIPFLGGPTGIETAVERLMGYEQAMSAAQPPSSPPPKVTSGSKAGGERRGTCSTRVQLHCS